MSLLGTALAFGFWPEERKAMPAPSSVHSVQTASVKSAVVERAITLSGITRASRRAVLAFTVSARLDRRPVDVGETVRKGELIALLDVRQFDNAVASARARKAELDAQYRQAERDRRRFAQLQRENVVPVGEYERVSATADRLEAALSAADAGLQEAERARSEAELRAPFSGTITAVLLEPGEWAMPGLPVVELSGDRDVEVEVDVPENVIGYLSEGSRVDVTLPFAGNRQLVGRVDALARAALSSGRLFPLVVALDASEKVVPGMTAEVTLTVPTEPRLLVPVDAVVNPGASRPSVFVVIDGMAREVPVRLGMFAGADIVVSGALSAGDRVVVSGHTALADGKKVVAR
jgi:RND family efflux transporter MFP subunit